MKPLKKRVAYLLLFSAAIGGIAGALMLGWLLEETARMIFGLQEFNLIALIPWFVVMFGLMTVGTVTLVFSYWVESKPLKWAIIAFSIPVPIVVEIVDLTVRGFSFMHDLYAHYGLL